jgi:hypothetical protein
MVLMSIVRFFVCAARGHVWDVAPRFRRDTAMECVRCGWHAEPAAGLLH